MTTEQKAVDLINEVRGELKLPPFSIKTISRHINAWDEAFCRAIERHEAFRREVSDAAKMVIEGLIDGHPSMSASIARAYLSDLILPEPDPLAEALKDAGIDPDAVFKVLEANGLEVVEVGHD